MAEQALAGIRVLDLCQMVAGPYCAKLLGDLGAEVTKIEPPGSGDMARQRAPFVGDQPHPDRSLLFLYVNTSKKGITLDVSKPGGMKLLELLAKDTDILLHDYQPAQAAAVGLQYERFRAVNPALVMVALTPFGSTGPYKDFKAYPLNTFHAGGEGYLTPAGAQYLDRPPVRVGKYVGEYSAGLSATIAILGALYWQRITGQGQFVDVSKQEALISLNPIELNRYPNHNMVASRASRVTSYGGIMPCKDGYVELSLYEDHEWEALVKLMGEPAWTREEKYKDRPARVANGLELNRRIAEWSSQQSKADIVPRGQALGCPIGPYNTTKEVCDSEQMRARGFFKELSHPVAGTFAYPTAAYHFSHTPWQAQGPAPLLGEHNDEVYGKRLGLSQKALDSLREDNVI
ncbi:MAG: CoA transferase [Chloroflexi bacterium]|nr:CoA transferase [Chloroflexota bacterium]